MSEKQRPDLVVRGVRSEERKGSTVQEEEVEKRLSVGGRVEGGFEVKVEAL